MAQYLAITYTADVDWFAPAQAEELGEYRAFARDNADSIRSSAVLSPTDTATVVRVRENEVLTTHGPYAETPEAITGYYLVEADDLDAAVRIAALIPAARNGAVELRPVLVWR